jgi:hypothetical protein
MIDGRPLLAILNEWEVDTTSSEAALRVRPDSRLQVEEGRLLMDGECLLAVSPTGRARLEGSALYVAGALVHTFGPEEVPHPAALPSSLQADGNPTGMAFYRAGKAPLLVLRGQRLDIEPGHVEINGKPLAEGYIAQTPRYRMKPTRLGKDEYFVLGDNRNLSEDSHRWGALAGNAIIGKAWAMFWPLGRVGLVN